MSPCDTFHGCAYPVHTQHTVTGSARVTGAKAPTRAWAAPQSGHGWQVPILAAAPAATRPATHLVHHAQRLHQQPVKAQLPAVVQAPRAVVSNEAHPPVGGQVGPLRRQCIIALVQVVAGRHQCAGQGPKAHVGGFREGGLQGAREGGEVRASWLLG